MKKDGAINTQILKLIKIIEIHNLIYFINLHILINMVTKNYSVCLDEKIVKRAKRIMKEYGGKLSPLINEFLIRFTEEHKKGAE